MRVMIDTNVLLSSFLFPSPTMNAFINLVLDQHRIVLAAYRIDESHPIPICARLERFARIGSSN